jgi:hypothetical protein
MEKKIINLTYNDVVIEARGKTTIIKKSGSVSRCNILMIPTDDINDMPCWEKDILTVETILPEKKEGTVYLVSAMVMDNNPDRDDLIAPNTSRQTKIVDANGKTIGARGFQKLKKKT